MTSVEQVMPDYPMAEQADDMMEDSADLQLQDQGGEEIDIDSGFNENTQLDERMAEDDFQLIDFGNTIQETGFDKDDEMADDEQPDQLLDHDIQDAPQEADIASIQQVPTEVPMGELQDPDPFDEDLNTTADDAFDFGGNEGLHVQPEASLVLDEGNGKGILQEAALEVAIEDVNKDTTIGQIPHTDANESVSVADPAIDTGAFHENLGNHDTTTDTFGGQDVSEDTDSKKPSLAREELHEQAQSGHDVGTDLISSNREADGEVFSHDQDTAFAARDDAEESAADSVPPNTSSAPINGPAPDAAISDAEGLRSAPVMEGPTIQGYRDGLGQEQDEHAPTALEDDSVEDKHPIIVEFNGQRLSLFVPLSDEESDTFLLSDYSLIEQDLSALMHACRSVLGADIESDEDLVLSIPVFGLQIAERTEEATTTSLAQLRDMFIHLSHNDGQENPEPLHLGLSTRLKAAARLDALRAMIEQGKGLKDLGIGTEIPEDGGDLEELSDFGSSSHAENRTEQKPLQAGRIADPSHSAKEIENDGSKGDKTLLLDDREDDKDDLIDFGSPLHNLKSAPEEKLAEEHDNLANQVVYGSGADHEQAAFEDEDENDRGEDGLVGNSEFDKYFSEDTALAEASLEDQDFHEATPEDFLQTHVGIVPATDADALKDEFSAPSPPLQGDENKFLAGKVHSLKAAVKALIYSVDNPDHSNGETDKNSLRKLNDEELDVTEDIGDGNLAFDFDDFTKDYGPALDNQPGQITNENKSTGFLDDTTASSKADDFALSTDAVTGNGNNSRQTDKDHGFDFDEIDFHEDEDLEADTQFEASAEYRIANSMRDKSGSLKRSRPPGDGVDVIDASPSKCRRCAVQMSAG